MQRPIRHAQIGDVADAGGIQEDGRAAGGLLAAVVAADQDRAGSDLVHGGDDGVGPSRGLSPLPAQIGNQQTVRARSGQGGGRLRLDRAQGQRHNIAAIAAIAAGQCPGDGDQLKGGIGRTSAVEIGEHEDGGIESPEGLRHDLLLGGSSGIIPARAGPYVLYALYAS